MQSVQDIEDEAWRVNPSFEDFSTILMVWLSVITKKHLKKLAKELNLEVRPKAVNIHYAIIQRITGLENFYVFYE